MEITHRTRSIRIAPRKLRMVVDKVRHMSTSEALEVLPLLNKGGKLEVINSIKAAVKAAEDQNLDHSTLVIQRAWCDEGKCLKRVVRFSRGRTARMMKKYSHLSLVLVGEPKARVKQAKAAAAKTAAPSTDKVTGEETASKDKE